MEGRLVYDICYSRHGEYRGKEIQGPEPSARKVVVADRRLVDDPFLDDGEYVDRYSKVSRNGRMCFDLFRNISCATSGTNECEERNPIQTINDAIL